jgi:hypothetical protein
MKGQKTGGRKKGSLNKATIEAREACAKLVDDPVYQATLRRRLLQGKLAPAMETMLWHYAKGKPKEHVELSHDAELLALLDAGRLRNATRDPQP